VADAAGPRAGPLHPDALQPAGDLGAGGKMGPTLAGWPGGRRTRPDTARLSAVSRFSNEAARAGSTARRQDNESRPSSSPATSETFRRGNVLYLVGLKFGTRRTRVDLGDQHPRARPRRGALSPIADGALSTAMCTRSRPSSRAVRWKRTPSHSTGGIRQCRRGPRTDLRVLRATERRPDRAPPAVYAVELRYGVIADLAGRIHDGTPSR